MLTEQDGDEWDDAEKDDDAVPYTTDDELMTSIVDTAKKQFGADFSKIKSPMLYHPEDGNVTLSGEVGSLNDAKFQFHYKDNGTGCRIWINPISLNNDTLRTLSVIYGVYKNWQKELASSEDIKPMSLNNNTVNGQHGNMVPGDDFGTR